MLPLALIADAVPRLRLLVLTVVTGVPGKVLADSSGDARFVGYATLLTAAIGGAVLIINTLVDAFLKVYKALSAHRAQSARAARRRPTAAEAKRARELLERYER